MGFQRTPEQVATSLSWPKTVVGDKNIELQIIGGWQQEDGDELQLVWPPWYSSRVLRKCCPWKSQEMSGPLETN